MNQNLVPNVNTVLCKILSTREPNFFDSKNPFWKLRLSQEEYDSLKKTIFDHRYELHNYSIESALCYAEWWRRDYRGDKPSKEDVAEGVGLDKTNAVDLFNAAKSALEDNNYKFIHSRKGKEYFRTLLNQGGLPISYIKKNGFGNFTRFLAGLVRELSSVNFDWDNEDVSIIEQFNCISYLGKSFRNENIYDVALQIAHAIIMEENELLPYDDSDDSLSELTKSLTNEYHRAKTDKHFRPLSLNWKLKLNDDGSGLLFVNMEVVKKLSSDSIPGLNYQDCYSFDIFVTDILVCKYVRSELSRDENGETTGAIYSQIPIGINKDIIWKGEPVVEVKVRCDNDDRIFPTITGCYPPNFKIPQVFQLLYDDIYVKNETANSEDNIVIFTEDWINEDASDLRINGHSLKILHFRESVSLRNKDTEERVCLTNKFTPYSVEFSGVYIPWVEKSNYKIINRTPKINVYDKEKKRISNVKSYYSCIDDDNWRPLTKNSSLPLGIVNIKVAFPDDHCEIESFYNIKSMEFHSQNEDVDSTDIICKCEPALIPTIEKKENLDIENKAENTWHISRKKDAEKQPTECTFHIYKEHNPALIISIAIPFDGVQITHVNGKQVADKQIISFSNLSHYRILSNGSKKRKITISYSSEREEDQLGIYLRSNIINGIVPLSDYYDFIVRMFNIYGINSFDRTSSVVINVPGKQVFIRRFVLDSKIDNDAIYIYSNNDDNSEFEYEGSIFAVSVDEPITSESFYPTELIVDEENKNIFHFPKEYESKEVIIFSGADSRHRIIPKKINRNADFKDEDTYQNIISWNKILREESIYMGETWGALCNAFEVCSKNDLPFTTFNGFKAMRSDANLIVKFILSMWLNAKVDILSQNIETFEQELVTAVHWIPATIWGHCIGEMLSEAPEPLQRYLSTKLSELHELLQKLFYSTLSIDVANELAQYITSGFLGKGQQIRNADIRNYMSRIHGISEGGNDLPCIQHNIKGKYYPEQIIRSYYRTMIESAMCAAENVGEVKGATNLFSQESKQNGRIINFYRRYYKEIYSEIYIRTLKIINNQK